MPPIATRKPKTLSDYGWKRSRRGNLWQRFEDGTTITVFSWGEGFRVCIHQGDEPLFLRSTYDTEEDAVEGAAEWLEG